MAIQKKISVQEILEKKFKKFLKKKIKVIGSGRTDAFVRSKCTIGFFKIKIKDKKTFDKFYNFFLANYLISIIDLKKKSLNFILDIAQKKEFMNIE